MSKKRKHTYFDDDGNVTTAPGRKRAIAIAAKMRKKYPYSTYGIAHYKRGTTENLGRYGESYKSASAEQRAQRKSDGYYGRGKYGRGDYSDWKPWLKKWVPKGSLAALGGAAGSMLGMGGVGSALGGMASNYLGWGDYGGSAGGNQIMAGSVDKPITVNASDDLSGDVYISHREFIGNVQALVPSSGLSLFNINSFPINVGLAGSFPWLSQIAQNFTLYELHGLIYEYRPTSGELGSSSNQLGKVVMATQYDPDAPIFTTSIQMENYDYANACKPSQGMCHGVETAPRQSATNMLYTRSGPVTRDKIFTDVGLFQIATEGVPVSGTAGSYQNIGELWVTYRVKLSRASLVQTIGSTILSDYFYGAFSSTMCDNTTTSMASSAQLTTYYDLPLANTYFAEKKTNNIGITATSATTSTVTLTWPSNINSGAFRITVWVNEANNSASIWAAPASLANCTLVQPNTGSGLTNSYYAPNSAISGRFKSQTFVISINAPGLNVASLVLTGSATFVASGGSCFIFVEQVNPLNITRI